MLCKDMEKQKEYSRRYYQKHKEKIKEYERKYRQEHEEQLKKYRQEHKEEVRERHNKYCKKYYQEHKGQFREYHQEHKEERRESCRRYYQKHKEKRLVYNRDWWKKIRNKVLSYYSPGELRCACCGEKNFGFLTLDHVNQDGAEHRRLVGRSNGVYLWIIKKGFPPGFQVLCYNCNLGRARNGGVCPHEEERLNAEKMEYNI
jgi:hypothetical protein